MRLRDVADIAGRPIGDNHPCFLVFEAGPTHDGLESAKELVRFAHEAGADALKFQMTNPDRLVADREQLFTYKILVDRANGAVDEISEPLYDILVRRRLSHDDWAEVKSYCDSLGIIMYATVGFLEDLRHLVEIGCPAIKIASNDVNHFPMIREAARSGLNVQLDTGNAKIAEVEEAIDLVLSEGNDNIIIHHCPSGYPARMDGINLNIIPTLKRMFECPVAFSDHSPGWDMDIAALALGANMIEKTITRDRTTRSVEHMFSLEPPETDKFVDVIRSVEIGFGSKRRTFTPEEMAGRQSLRRSAFLKFGVRKGDIISLSTIEFRRPGSGIGPDRWDEIEGRKFAQDMSEDHLLNWSDIE